MHADPATDSRGDSARHATRVRATRRDATTIEESRDFAYGSSRNPMSRADTEEKYRRLARTVQDEAAVAELADVVSRLDALPDLDHLGAALAPTPMGSRHA